jgi:putative FmdB family regulatory protein
MPIYEYRCQSCGFEKEYLQKLSDAPISQCPSCGKADMVKMVTAAGFQLKGSGWYATDFKGGPKPTGKAEDGEKKEQPKSDQPAAEKAASEPASPAPACGAGGCPACS